MIARLARATILSEGWRRALIAFASGAVGALAMPPVGFWPALILSLCAAVWLIDGSAAGGRLSGLGTLARAATAGWWWGFGYFVAGLWWIGAAFLVEADTFAWLLPFGVLGLPAVAAVYPALGFALARALWSDGPARIFALATGLTAAEWLRGHLFTGFPWNTFGMAFGQNLWLLQSASILGLYGLTTVVVLVLATPAMLGTEPGHLRRFGPVTCGAIGLVAMATFGAIRIPAAAQPSVPNVRLRIMQPNISQDSKFNSGNGQAILRRYLALSDRATSPQTTGLGDVTHLVWPESAFPFLLNREPVALSEIAAALPPGAVLVTGAARGAEALPGESGMRYFNSIEAVDTNGDIVASYDKNHLVPFGEYVPAFLDSALRALGVRQFVSIPGGFTAGERKLAIAVPGLPLAAASICYEAIFPGETMPSGPRPGLILNVTNDGWFGNTAGPHQHFAQARMRAVERGLPLVRAANTGISAVVDPFGRTLTSLGLGREGVIDSTLPRVANETVFAEYGTALCLMLFGACAAVAASARYRSGPVQR